MSWCLYILKKMADVIWCLGIRIYLLALDMPKLISHNISSSRSCKCWDYSILNFEDIAHFFKSIMNWARLYLSYQCHTEAQILRFGQKLFMCIPDIKWHATAFIQRVHWLGHGTREKCHNFQISFRVYFQWRFHRNFRWYVMLKMISQHCFRWWIDAVGPIHYLKQSWPKPSTRIYVTRRQRINKLTWSWWRHQMKTLSASLVLCAWNSPVTGEFPTQRPVTRSFDVVFDLRLYKRLSKQSWGWWSETTSCSLWRHCNLKCEIRRVLYVKHLSTAWISNGIQWYMVECYYISVP